VAFSDDSAGLEICRPLIWNDGRVAQTAAELPSARQWRVSTIESAEKAGFFQLFGLAILEHAQGDAGFQAHGLHFTDHVEHRGDAGVDPLEPGGPVVAVASGDDRSEPRPEDRPTAAVVLVGGGDVVGRSGDVFDTLRASIIVLSGVDER